MNSVSTLVLTGDTLSIEVVDEPDTPLSHVEQPSRSKRARDDDSFTYMDGSTKRTRVV